MIDFKNLERQAGQARAQGADLLEVRVDRFPPSVRSADALRLARRFGPVLLTIRSRKEGGGWRGTEAARLALFRALIPAADAVDVEGASPVAGAVLRAAKRAGKWTVLSHHDFAKTPSDAALRRMGARFKRSGADVLKVAAMPRSARDVDRLMAFCAGLEGRRAFIAMGALGRRTRTEPARWGSCLTYGSVGAAAAPGQVPVKTLRRLLDARQK